MTGTAASSSEETVQVRLRIRPFFLDDPEGVWKGKLVGLTLAIRDHLPDCQLEMLTPVAGGYRIRPRDVDGFESAFSKAKSAFGNVSLSRVSTPSRPVEVILRGVDPGFSCPEILEDLRSSFGQEIRAVRRLHASTEGKIDFTRPLPVVIVTVGEECASQLKGGVKLFGVLNVRPSTPRAKAQVTQCSRCFAWGHRAAACTSRRRCIRCGSVDHVSQTCPEPAGVRKCFACKGDHTVTYAGCPSSTAARRLMTSALTPAAKNRQSGPSVPFSRGTDGRSFADVAKSGRADASADWTLVSRRRQPLRTDASPVLEQMETETCAQDRLTTMSLLHPGPSKTLASAEPSSTRVQQDRTAKSRELAIKTRDIKKRLHEIEEERKNIADAKDCGLSSRRLSRRLRTITGHYKRLTQSLKDLEKQRASLSTKVRVECPRQSSPRPSPPTVVDESPRKESHVSRSRSRSRRHSPQSTAPFAVRPQSTDLTAMVVDAMR